MQAGKVIFIYLFFGIKKNTMVEILTAREQIPIRNVVMTSSTKSTSAKKMVLINIGYRLPEGKKSCSHPGMGMNA